MPTYAPYQSRPLTFLGIESVAGYRLKMYAIRYGEETFERRRFAAGWELAVKELPPPAASSGCPGVGFTICHRGRTGDYLVLGWWDRENELPTRIF